MRCITITNIPEDLYQALVHSAQKNRRNMNHEILVSLHTALEAARQQPAMPSSAQLRTKSLNAILPEKYLNAAISEAIAKL